MYVLEISNHTAAALGNVLSLVLALGLIGCANLDASRAPAKGSAQPQMAPDMDAIQLDGSAVRTSEFWRERSALFVFMNTWCAACREEAPHLGGLADRYEVVTVFAGEAPAEVAAFRRQLALSSCSLLDDGTLASAFGVHATPTLLVVDSQGVIAYRGSELPQ